MTTVAGFTRASYVEADTSYQSDRFDNQDNQLVLPSYWVANFRSGSSNDQWDVLAYVDNAFDDDAFKTGFSVFANHGALLKPDSRTYGLRVNYRFGK